MENVIVAVLTALGGVHDPPQRSAAYAVTDGGAAAMETVMQVQ
jgi:hypothetical protein